MKTIPCNLLLVKLRLEKSLAQVEMYIIYTYFKNSEKCSTCLRDKTGHWASLDRY